MAMLKARDWRTSWFERRSTSWVVVSLVRAIREISSAKHTSVLFPPVPKLRFWHSPFRSTRLREVYRDCLSGPLAGRADWAPVMWRLRLNSAGEKDEVGCCWERERRALREVDLGAAIEYMFELFELFV